MKTPRRIVVLTSVAFLCSCGSSTTSSSIPQIATADVTTQQTQSLQTIQQTTATSTQRSESMQPVLSVDKESGSSAAVVTASATPLPAGEIAAGPGYSDVSPHQLVRTSRNVLYVSVPSCISYPTCYGNSITMEAGNKEGTPTAFSAQDTADEPKSPTSKDAIGSTALAIDGNDVIWEAYNTRNYGTIATSFDTKTNRWGAKVRLGTTSAGGGWVSQGKEGVGMAVDKSGRPHVVFSFIGSDKMKHVATAEGEGSAWSSAVQLDDTKLASGYGALHPTVAFTPDDVMLVAWLVGNENLGYNTPDGTIRVREVPLSGGAPASVEIPDTIHPPNTGYAATVIDNGPSILVTSNGVAHVSYIDTNDMIRYWYSNGTDYKSWNGSLQPHTQQSHDPSLGPDGSGGIYIYGHGTPAGNQNGHGNNMYRFRRPAGSNTWSSFEEVVTDNNIDCSVSTRWAQFFNNFPTEVDWTYWDDRYPNSERVTTH
jgi:hypothetical protein